MLLLVLLAPCLITECLALEVGSRIARIVLVDQRSRRLLAKFLLGLLTLGNKLFHELRERHLVQPFRGSAVFRIHGKYAVILQVNRRPLSRRFKQCLLRSLLRRHPLRNTPGDPLQHFPGLGSVLRSLLRAAVIDLRFLDRLPVADLLIPLRFRKISHCRRSCARRFRRLRSRCRRVGVRRLQRIRVILHGIGIVFHRSCCIISAFRRGHTSAHRFNRRFRICRILRFIIVVIVDRSEHLRSHTGCHAEIIVVIVLIRNFLRSIPGDDRAAFRGIRRGIIHRAGLRRSFSAFSLRLSFAVSCLDRLIRSEHAVTGRIDHGRNGDPQCLRDLLRRHVRLARRIAALFRQRRHVHETARNTRKLRLTCAKSQIHQTVAHERPRRMRDLCGNPRILNVAHDLLDRKRRTVGRGTAHIDGTVQPQIMVRVLFLRMRIVARR